MEAREPVVVVGESLNCLGILRSLAGQGIELHVVATTRWCAPALSRHARLHLLPDLDGRVLIDGLKDVARRLGRRAVLMLGGDRQVEIVNEHRDELEPLFQFTLPAADQVRTLANKASFQQWAQDAGLPVPRTVIARDADQLAAALRDLTLPLVIKPADKLQVLNGNAERAVRVDTALQAEACATRMLAGCGCIVVQEWIVGGDADIYFGLFVCDADSRVRAMFCGRKLVCDPPEVGSTGICVDAGEHTDAVARETERFIAAAGYRGIGSVEFKRDRRTGVFVIVEPTIGRTDWQEEIATQCGVNLPLQSYLAECGLPAAPARTVATPPAWSASLFYPRPRETLADGVRIRDAYLRLDDPLPGLHHYLVHELARRALRRAARLWHSGSARALEARIARNARP
jgi:predicted ATP-grasp superfamily ATP-dependent carboligase